MPSPCRPDDFRWLLLLMHHSIALTPQVDPTGALGVSGMLTCYSLSESCVTPGHRLVVDAGQDSSPRRPAVIPKSDHTVIERHSCIKSYISPAWRHLLIATLPPTACGHHRA